MNYQKLTAGVDLKYLPVHIAIVMDGNGRWAKERGLTRGEGHRAGSENLNRLIDFLLFLGVKNVSLYAFSTENWRRPPQEIKLLWNLMNEYFTKRLDFCIENGIRIRTSGDISRLPVRSRKIIEIAALKTAKNRKLTANFCLNYGSHDEILMACNRIILEKVSQKDSKPIKLKEFERQLSTHPLPAVDLFIRPGGEVRISNFLLWQSAYAELYFSKKYWPQFRERDLIKAIEWFQGRERRYGALK